MNWDDGRKMSEGGSKSKKSFRELPAFCRQGKQAALCFLALLFVAPYLQHNLYHTTLFARYGDSDFAVFSLFSVILAAWLILCIIAQKKVAFWLDSRRGAAIAAGAATVGTATIYFAPSFVEGVPMLAWGLFGASCYAAGFAYLAIRSFLVLGVYGRRAGLKASVVVAVLSALASHVAFSFSVPAPWYVFIAVCGLGLSSGAQCAFGPLRTGAAAPESEVLSSNAAGVFGFGWRFFYVIFFATVLLHGLLYVADPALEFLGDAPLSRGVTFFLLLALVVFLLATPPKSSQCLRVVCLFGNILLAVLFLGLAAVSFFSFTQGDFSAAAGVVLALIRVFDVLLLVAMLGNTFLRGSNLVRASATYMLALYWLPTTFAYVLLPIAAAGRKLEALTLLGPASLALAAALALAVVVFLTLLMVRAGRSGGILPSDRAQGEGREDACGVVAQEHGLTQREGEILYLVSLGYSSKAIGEKLFVAPGTVQSHTKRIYSKLDVHSKQALIKLIDEAEGRR